jgi:hypothetical protein
MRNSICTLGFLVLTPLAHAQISTFIPGQTSCQDFWASRNLLMLRYVRPVLEQAVRGAKVIGGGVVDAQLPGLGSIKMLGDGTSVGVSKTVSPKDLTKPEFVKAYLQVIRTAFSEPQWIVCPEDKSPEVTLFLLDYLREKVNDQDLRRQIYSTEQYILNQTKVDSKPSGNDARYTQTAGGEGYLDGVFTILYSYRAPDGEIISTARATIGSADGDAAKTFHQEIDHSAAEIVKQEDFLDESGKVIGYRSVLTLVDKDGKRSTAIVMTKGSNFTRYMSSSLPDLLAFEEYEKLQAAEHAKQ